MLDLTTTSRVTFDTLNSLPETSGVYLVVSDSEVIYVGQTKNLHARWLGHSRRNQLKSFPNVEVCYMEMPLPDAVVLEKSLIAQLKPRLNWTRVVGNPTTVFSVRIPKMTEQQIAAIMKQYGISKTEAVILAIDRLERSMRRKRKAEKGGNDE